MSPGEVEEMVVSGGTPTEYEGPPSMGLKVSRQRAVEAGRQGSGGEAEKQRGARITQPKNRKRRRIQGPCHLDTVDVFPADSTDGGQNEW